MNCCERASTPSASGVKRTYISEGKYKLVGKPTEALSEEDHSEIKAGVHEAYERFIADVSRGRKVSKTDVRNGYGEGRMVGATEALALGMVDRVATLSDTVARLSPGQAPAMAASTHTPQAADLLDLHRALFELELSAFPAVVVIDCSGQNLHDTARRQWRTEP